MIWLALLPGSLVALFALFGLALWIWTTILSFIQVSQHTLASRSMKTQVPFAFAVTGSVLFALSFFVPVVTFDPGLAHSWAETVLFVGSGGVGGLCLLLWLCTLVLYFLPAVPTYTYFLPQDAQRVRWLECQQGIRLAASFYPEQADAETLEHVARGVAVLWRHERYPRKGRHATQFTNDFATYTRLCIEGISVGYRCFFQSCQHAPDHLEQQRKAIKEGWPADPEVHRLVEELATAYLAPPTPPE